MSTDGPNLIKFGWSIVRTLATVEKPAPTGNGSVDHSLLRSILAHMDGDVRDRLADAEDDLAQYLDSMAAVEPDTLSRAEALAFWLNVYNAAAMRLAARALATDISTVLGVPGAFTSPALTVAGESLSLDNIEHGKVRRFRDPRVHAGLVCGSISCPTLRGEPFGPNVDRELDLQMRAFLAAGAAVVDRGANRLTLSPIFSWFGADFTRPRRMPTLLPANAGDVASALTAWLDPPVADWVQSANPDVRFADYNWLVGCTVG